MNEYDDRSNVTRQYAQLASEYDSRWAYYVRATTDATIKLLPDEPGDVLDIGCGTGELLSRLSMSNTASRLTGVDASSEMLEVARARLSDDVSLSQCWAEDLPFGNCMFDTVSSCNMFHFIRHPDKALMEMLRVLRPGGMLIITDWCDDYLLCKLCDVYLRWFDPAHFRMYGTSDCHMMLKAANTQCISIKKFKVSILWGLMSATARKPVSTGKEEHTAHL